MRRTICESALLNCRKQNEDGELVEMSDGGSGMRQLYGEINRTCFGSEPCSVETSYARMSRKALDFVRLRDSTLLPTLNAILKNGRNRQESIFELAKKPKGKRELTAAEKQYYRTRAKLLHLFGA